MVIAIQQVVKVYISGRFVYRTLRHDGEGLYIKYKNQRITVRLDPYTKLYYIAVMSHTPLHRLEQEYKQLVSKASDRSTTSQHQLLEIRQQLTKLRRQIKTASFN